MVKPYYEDDGVSIYHGDARDVAADLPRESVDLMLSDPLYGMGYTSTAKNAFSANVAADGVRQGVRIVRQVLQAASPVLRPDAHLLLFCHWQSWPDFYDAVCPHAPVKNALIWHKAAGSMGNIRADYRRDYEVILYARRGDREIDAGPGEYTAVLLGHDREHPSRRVHPTQKPVGLTETLLRRHCPVGGLVFDPFMGSGTTLVAAKAIGRRAIGIEIEERYCEVAARRLSQEVLPLVSQKPAA